MKIIAFGHSSRVGKNACCRAIEDCWHAMDRRCNATSFAYELKLMSWRLFQDYGLMPGEFYEYPDNAHFREEQLDKIGLTPVEVWIKVGRKMREVYPGIWVDLAIGHLYTEGLNLISDLRFQNEAAAVRAHGGICVKVTRPDAPAPKESDKEFPEGFFWDDVIVNDGSLSDLGFKAIEMTEAYLKASEQS